MLVKMWRGVWRKGVKMCTVNVMCGNVWRTCAGMCMDTWRWLQECVKDAREENVWTCVKVCEHDVQKWHAFSEYNLSIAGLHVWYLMLLLFCPLVTEATGEVKKWCGLLESVDWWVHLRKRLWVHLYGCTFFWSPSHHYTLWPALASL